MKVYGMPDEIQPPELKLDQNRRYDSAATIADEQRCLSELRSWMNKEGFTGELAGEIVRFPVADGYACYLVIQFGRFNKSTGLVHLPFGDAYAIPEAYSRGLRVGEIRKMVEQGRALARLVSMQATAAEASSLPGTNQS